jgi:hypothetical protein
MGQVGLFIPVIYGKNIKIQDAPCPEAQMYPPF